jgi:hypothetical protein
MTKIYMAMCVLVLFLFTGCNSIFFNVQKKPVTNTNITKTVPKKPAPLKQKIPTLNLCENNNALLNNTYLKRHQGVCIAQTFIPFVHVINSSQDLGVLNAVSKTTHYSSDKHMCQSFVSTLVKGNDDDNTVAFKHSFKEQILEYYDNACFSITKNDIDFLQCKNRKKNDFFLTVSKKRNQGIFEKHLLQVPQSCFLYLKNPKKFTKKGGKKNIVHAPLYLASVAKRQMYNRNFYSDILFKRHKERFYLVGKKVYGKKNIPKKIEEYFFYSTDKNSGAKELLLNQNLVFEKKNVRIFDKQGLDQDGFDKFDWNVKLKKFRSQLKVQ